MIDEWDQFPDEPTAVADPWDQFPDAFPEPAVEEPLTAEPSITPTEPVAEVPEPLPHETGPQFNESINLHRTRANELETGEASPERVARLEELRTAYEEETDSTRKSKKLVDFQVYEREHKFHLKGIKDDQRKMKELGMDPMTFIAEEERQLANASLQHQGILSRAAAGIASTAGGRALEGAFLGAAESMAKPVLRQTGAAQTARNLDIGAEFRETQNVQADKEALIGSTLSKGLRQATESLVLVAPFAAAGGTGGAAAVFGLLGAEEGYHAARDRGYTRQQAAAYGLGMGLAEAIPMIVGGKVAGKFGGATLEEMLAGKMPKGFLTTLGGLITEGGEEAVTLLAQSYLDQVSKMDPNAMAKYPERLKEVLIATGIGFGMARSAGGRGDYGGVTGPGGQPIPVDPYSRFTDNPTRDNANRLRLPKDAVARQGQRTRLAGTALAVANSSPINEVYPITPKQPPGEDGAMVPTEGQRLLPGPEQGRITDAVQEREAAEVHARETPPDSEEVGQEVRGEGEEIGGEEEVTTRPGIGVPVWEEEPVPDSFTEYHENFIYAREHADYALPLSEAIGEYEEYFTPAQRGIFDHLPMDEMKDLQVFFSAHVQKLAPEGELSSTATAFYQPNQRDVRSRFIAVGQLDTSHLPTTLLHEAIHAGTSFVIDKPPSQRTAKEQAAVDRLETIRERIRTERMFEPGSRVDLQTRNIDEFVAGLAHPEVVADLMGFSFEGENKKKTVWKEIVDTIASLFGIPRKYQDAFEAALENMSEITGFGSLEQEGPSSKEERGRREYHETYKPPNPQDPMYAIDPSMQSMAELQTMIGKGLKKGMKFFFGYEKQTPTVRARRDASKLRSRYIDQHIHKLNNTMKEMEQTLRKEFNIKWSDPIPFDVDHSAYFVSIGQVPPTTASGKTVNFSPETMQKLKDARRTLDSMSLELSNHPDFQGTQLGLTITKNMGRYITRFYNQYRDPKHLARAMADPVKMKNFRDEAWNVVQEYAYQLHLSRNPNNNIDIEDYQYKDYARYIMATTKVKPNDILKELLAGKDIKSLISEHRLNRLAEISLDRGSPKQRKNAGRGQSGPNVLSPRAELPEAYRTLKGEVQSFFEGYATSFEKVAKILSEKKFLDNMVMWGRQTGMVSDGATGPMGNYRQLTGIPSIGAKMEGVYFHPELADMITAEFAPDMLSGIGKTPVARQTIMVSRWLKKMLTVHSLSTTAGNFIGNVPIAMMAGHLGVNEAMHPKEFLMTMRDTLAAVVGPGAGDFFSPVARRNLNWGMTPEIQRIREQLARNGINEDHMLRDLEVLNKIIKESESILETAGKRKGGWARYDKLREQLYRFGDTLFKYNGFLKELGKIQKLHPNWSTEKQEMLASDITRSLYITYDSLPDAVKLISRIPVIGNIGVMFSAGMVTSVIGNGRLAYQDFKNGNILSGLNRVKNFVIAGAIYEALHEMSQDDEEITDEMDDDINKFLPDYEQYKNRIYLKKKGDSLSYINTGYRDPYGGLKTIFYATVDGDHERAAKEVGNMFLGMDPTFDLLNAVLGKDSYGRAIFDPNLDDPERVPGGFRNMFMRFLPGDVQRAEQVFEGWQGKVTTYGKKRRLDHELAANLGVRVMERDIPTLVTKGLRRASSSMRDTVLAAGSQEGFGAPEGSLSVEQIADKYRSYARQDQVKFKTLTDLYDRAVRLVGEPQAKRMLRDVADRRIFGMVLRGQWSPPPISREKRRKLTPAKARLYKNLQQELR